MTDPLGLIGSTTPVVPATSRATQATPGVGFKDLLEQQLAQVNELQQDAKEAAEDLISGKRNDLENVIMATRKADTAFRMLLQVRNKMMDAYEEVKQIRV